ncbi:MAG: glycosyltransferase family 2 protein [Solirubrobacterales bacterium]
MADAVTLPAISVILCFVDDGATAPHCIDAILENDTSREVEVVAVNNRPSEGDAAGLRNRYAEEPRVVVVEQPKRGRSAARNAGALAARAELLVFTDDDVVPTSRWLRVLRAAIESEPGAICATGPTQPLRLETPAQILMDRYAGFVKAETRTVFRLPGSIDNPLFPYAAGQFGSGANIAITSEGFERLGRFDETLGIGTESRGGEDLEFFMRLMLAGEAIVYEPDAPVLHDHPDTFDSLKAGVFGRGSGLTAAVTRTLVRGPHRARLLRALGAGTRFALHPESPKHERKGSRYPLGLTLRELAGMAYGPIGLLRSALNDRRMSVLASASAETSFEPIWVSEVELDSLPRAVKVPQNSAARYIAARILVRRSGRPLGFVELPLRGASISDTRIISAAAELEKRAEYRPAVAAADRPVAASVVVCTRERPESLARTLASLRNLEYPNFEVVVVDNAPLSNATERAVRECGDDRVRYVTEPRKGLSRARNRGVSEAEGELIAFTDDDIVVDPGWLSALAAAAGEKHVGCVTGIVPTAELETPAQLRFDQTVQWSRSFEPRLYDLNGHSGDHPLYPFKAGVFGTGANFAITRGAYDAVGAFDEALGAGTPAGGGEDLDYFLRIVMKGFALAYEPAAITWHYHRADRSTLDRQMWTYGSGLSAYAFKHAFTPSNWPLIAKSLARLTSSMVGSASVEVTAEPRERSSADRARMSGLLRGPDLYLTEKAKGMASRVRR